MRHDFKVGQVVRQLSVSIEFENAEVLITKIKGQKIWHRHKKEDGSFNINEFFSDPSDFEHIKPRNLKEWLEDGR